MVMNGRACDGDVRLGCEWGKLGKMLIGSNCSG